MSICALKIRLRQDDLDFAEEWCLTGLPVMYRPSHITPRHLPYFSKRVVCGETGADVHGVDGSKLPSLVMHPTHRVFTELNHPGLSEDMLAAVSSLIRRCSSRALS
jgi:hypothetical protein